MNIQSRITNIYYHNFELKLPGRLNYVHWYPWEWDAHSITIANDTDPELITFCEVLGDTLDVWVAGDRTQCKLAVQDNKYVLITIPVYAEEEATYNGPEITEHHVEIIK